MLGRQGRGSKPTRITPTLPTPAEMAPGSGVVAKAEAVVLDEPKLKCRKASQGTTQ